MANRECKILPLNIMLSRTNSTEKGPEDVETSSGMGAPSYYSSNGREPNYEETTELHQSIPVRILHSFKRNPNAQITPNGVLKNDGTIFQTNKAVAPESPLARRLKGRHLQMIAIGGSIGTSSSSRSSLCIRTLSDISQVLVCSWLPAKLLQLVDQPRYCSPLLSLVS